MKIFVSFFRFLSLSIESHLQLKVPCKLKGQNNIIFSEKQVTWTKFSECVHNMCTQVWINVLREKFSTSRTILRPVRVITHPHVIDDAVVVVDVVVVVVVVFGCFCASHSKQ